MDIVLELVLRSVLPGALASAAVMGLALAIVDKKWWSAAAAVAVAVGVLAANFLKQSAGYLPDDFGWSWLVPCAVVVPLLTALALHFRAPVVPVLAAVAAISVLFMPSAEWREPLWIAGLAAIVFANAWVLEHTAQQHHDRATPAALAVMLVGAAALTIGWAHFLRLTETALLVPAALVGPAICSLWKPIDLKAVAPTVGLLLPGVLLSGYENVRLYGPEDGVIPIASFLLIAAAPLSLAATWLPAVQRAPPWLQAALRVALPVAIVAVAIGWAITVAGLPEE